jgi:two-component sensor histidine kinase
VQAGAAANPDVKDALTSACGRVAAVARVHRRLYTSEQVTTVAADQYLLQLLNDLQVSSRQDNRGVILMLAAEPFQVDPDRAVAMGMVVSELVINASKYAYPDGEGPVRCGLRLDDGRVHLTVEDDGIGLPADTEKTNRGLGTLIVHSMASKLGADLTYESGEPGVRVNLVFPQFREADHILQN